MKDLLYIKLSTGNKVLVYLLLFFAFFMRLNINSSWLYPTQYDIYGLADLNLFFAKLGVAFDSYNYFPLLKLFSLIISLLLLFNIFQIAKRMLSSTVSALFTVAFIAVNPFLTHLGRFLSTENFVLLILSYIVIIIYDSIERKSLVKSLLVPLLLSIVVAIKVELVFLAFALVIASFLVRRNTGHIVIGLFLTLFSALVALSIIDLADLSLYTIDKSSISTFRYIAEYLLIPIIIFVIIYQNRFQLRLVDRTPLLLIILAVLSVIPVFLGYSEQKVIMSVSIASICLMIGFGGLLEFFSTQDKQYRISIYVFTIFIFAFSIYRLAILGLQTDNLDNARQEIHKLIIPSAKVLTDDKKFLVAMKPQLYLQGMIQDIKILNKEIHPTIIERLNKQKYNYILFNYRMSKDVTDKIKDTFISDYYKTIFAKKKVTAQGSFEDEITLYRNINYY